MNVTGSVTISGSGTIVDELRVHPLNSFLTTYTHKPLVGIRSQLDPRNQGVFYHYDSYGRLQTVTNDLGHILNPNYALAILLRPVIASKSVIALLFSTSP